MSETQAITAPHPDAAAPAGPGPVLTGVQKAAVVLMNMGREQAAQVLQQFSEAEAGEIAAEIMQMRRVHPTAAEAVVSEFHELSMKGGWQPRGGRDFAVGLLQATFGNEKAAGVLNRLASQHTGKSFEFLDAADASQVATLLDGELPQTTALVLAHLRPQHASAVLAALDPAERTDVARCIATMGSAVPEAVAMVAETLRVRAGAVVAASGPAEVVGGIQPLVEIINNADLSTERAVLDGLDESDPELAEEVRSRMLTFADLVKLEPRDVQQILRGIDASVLALAMKGSAEAVVETIRKNVSERNREVLDDEIKNLGPARLSQVEEARASVVRQIRDLEAAGTITVQRTEEDRYVY